MSFWSEYNYAELMSMHGIEIDDPDMVEQNDDELEEETEELKYFCEACGHPSCFGYCQ